MMQRIQKAVRLLREIFEVLPVFDRELGRSLDSRFKDFEDGVQNFTAENQDCDLIITRNKKDYAYSRLKVVTPSEYLLSLGRT